MWARIEYGAVVEITDIDPEGRFHPSLEWVQLDGRKNVQLGWLYTDGEFSEPEPAPEPVPEQVSRAQGKAALISSGLWQQVLDYVDDITDPTEKALANVALHDTTHWRRDSPTTQSIADALQVSSEQMDELFRNASKILL